MNGVYKLGYAVYYWGYYYGSILWMGLLYYGFIDGIKLCGIIVWINCDFSDCSIIGFIYLLYYGDDGIIMVLSNLLSNIIIVL